jgi:hypothetical protein
VNPQAAAPPTGEQFTTETNISESREITPRSPMTTEVGAIGVQLTGNSRIGTFTIHGGIDPATANIVKKLGEISRVLDSIQPHSVDEDPLFQIALREAQSMCESGQTADASRAFMKGIEQEERAERERQEYRRRLRSRLLEVGLMYDQRACNADAVFAKLRLLAEVIHPGDRNSQSKYLIDRASEYQGKGDSVGLQIAVLVFGRLAKDAIDVER